MCRGVKGQGVKGEMPPNGAWGQTHTWRYSKNEPQETKAAFKAKTGLYKKIKSAKTMKSTHLWTEALGFQRLKVPNSRFALRTLAPPSFTVCAPYSFLIHDFCAFFGPLLTPVSTIPFFASLSVHGFALHGFCAFVNDRGNLNRALLIGL